MARGVLAVDVWNGGIKERSKEFERLVTFRWWESDCRVETINHPQGRVRIGVCGGVKSQTKYNSSDQFFVWYLQIPPKNRNIEPNNKSQAFSGEGQETDHCFSIFSDGSSSRWVRLEVWIALYYQQVTKGLPHRLRGRPRHHNKRNIRDWSV